MERYTYFDGGKWRIRIGDTEYTGPWVDRLAAYEDTGLEPEEIGAAQKAMRSALALACEAQAYRAIGTVEALSALVKARAEAGAATGGGGDG